MSPGVLSPDKEVIFRLISPQIGFYIALDPYIRSRQQSNMIAQFICHSRNQVITLLSIPIDKINAQQQSFPEKVGIQMAQNVDL